MILSKIVQRGHKEEYVFSPPKSTYTSLPYFLISRNDMMKGFIKQLAPCHSLDFIPMFETWKTQQRIC